MSASDWAPTTYEIEQQDFPRRTVKGTTRGSFGIHKTKGARLWSVTHLASGYSAGLMPSYEAAVAYAEEIEPLTDWSAVTVENCIEGGVSDLCRASWERYTGLNSRPTPLVAVAAPGEQRS